MAVSISPVDVNGVIKATDDPRFIGNLRIGGDQGQMEFEFALERM